MPLKRHPQWQRKLAGMITSARELEFSWGSHDCAMWTCSVVRDVTGVDPGASFRGKYSTEAGAQAIFGTDLGNFAAGIAASLGMKEVKPNYARRGDIVHVDNGTTYGALGVVDLDARFAACVSQTGVTRIHLSKWKRAWQVG
jgi:hypothetical protein